jgi:hypothetical protein
MTVRGISNPTVRAANNWAALELASRSQVGWLIQANRPIAGSAFTASSASRSAKRRSAGLSPAGKPAGWSHCHQTLPIEARSMVRPSDMISAPKPLFDAR